MDVQMRHGLMSSTSVGLHQAQSRRLEYLMDRNGKPGRQPSHSREDVGWVAKCFFGMTRQ